MAPVARVAVAVAPPHLDRPFDYGVPAGMDADAVPGVRVKVRFAGRETDGFVLERVAASERPGALTPLRRVVSPEPVATPQVLRLARAVADRYVGTLVDVLRLAVPSRHARVEQEVRPPGAGRDPGPGSDPWVPPPGSAPDRRPDPWAPYAAGPAFVARLAAGQAPRAVWTALPGPGWADAVAAAVVAARTAGRGSLVVLPDRRDVDLVEAALVAALGPGRHARLEADLGPAARYRAWLSLLRGEVRVAVGTRAAALAPVADLGLVVVWDDGDDQHAEPRAPYPHVREVAVLRAEQDGAAVLIGSWSRTAEAAALVRDGWAREIEVARPLRRQAWPRVVLAAEAPQDRDPAALAARIPTAAWRAAQGALATACVLVQVPRSGYVPSTACARCRRPARCPHCAGPVRLSASGDDRAARTPRAARPPAGPGCRWCGRDLPGWACPHCGDHRLRTTAVGVDRTAEELGRAFPGASVLVSRPERTLATVPASGALVFATPGLEPFAPGGYGAALLLDGDALLTRPDLRAGEEALRRWRAAAALVRPAPDGGVVVLAADPQAMPVQALVRGDPAGHADRELEERTALGLPPGAAVASLTGAPAGVAALVDAVRLPGGASVLGPVTAGDPRDEIAVRTLLRVPPTEREALAVALRAAVALRSAQRDAGPVRVRIDPRDLG